MDYTVKQQRDLLGLLNDLNGQVPRVFENTREGPLVVNVDAFLCTRGLLIQLFKSLDAEVYRVCFEERLSNRSCCED